MPIRSTPPSPRRDVTRVRRIRNPLTRVGYALPGRTSHLLLLDAGEVWLGPSPAAESPGIAGPRLIWLSDGGDRELIVPGGARGTLVSVPLTRLVPVLPSPPLGDQFRRTLGRDMTAPLPEDPALWATVDALEEELTANAPGSELAERHVLGLLMIRLWRLARTDLVAHGGAPQGLAERFLRLAAQHRHDHWTVGRYAEELEVSRDRLGSAVRRATGMSPQAYVHRLLLREASELLAATGLPVAEIAFRLGFSDPAYFSRFFSRVAGSSPARFRASAKGRRAETSEPYAAWP